jgi:hypothetical protein
VKSYRQIHHITLRTSVDIHQITYCEELASKAMLQSSGTVTERGDVETRTTPDQPVLPSQVSLHIYADPATAPIPRLARVVATAGITDPFTILTNMEKHTCEAADLTVDELVRGNTVRISTKLQTGAIMVSAADFAAVACWQPPHSTRLIETNDGDLSFSEFAARPIMRKFFHDSALLRRDTFKGHDYWYLTLMARDPARPKVKGAVRAVLEAGIRWAEAEGMPIWLEAGNERARDVYAAFGFKAVGVTWTNKSGVEGEGIPTWGMVRRLK